MSGWRYTANIPSYINAKDSSGEPVVVGLALMHFADHLTFQLPHKASAAAPPLVCHAALSRQRTYSEPGGYAGTGVSEGAILCAPEIQPVQAAL